MLETFLGKFGFDIIKITLFSVNIYYWLIALILLLILVITNIPLLKEWFKVTINQFVKIGNWCWMELERIWKRLVVWIKLIRTKKETIQKISLFQDRYNFAFIMFANALLFYLLADLLYSIIKTEISKVALLLSTLVLLVIFLIIWVVLFVGKISDSKLFYIVIPTGFILIFIFKTVYPVTLWFSNDIWYNIFAFSWFVLYLVVAQYKKPVLNMKIAFTMMGALLFLYVGSILVLDFSSSQESELDRQLNNCLDIEEQLGRYHIICSDLSNKVLVDRQISCRVIPGNLSDVKAELRFTQLNGTAWNQSFNDSIVFIVPKDLGHLYLEVNFSDEQKNNLCGSWGYPITFANETQWRNNRKDLATYLIALFAIVFSSIPLLYKSYKELVEDLRR